MSLHPALLWVRIVLLLVLGGVFVALVVRPSSAWSRRLALGLFVVGVISYPNFGLFHSGPITPRHIHYYDAFHYFMGAKYLPEVGYTGLYETTLVAGRELGAFGDIAALRDLETYALREARSVDAREVRARFSAGRWTSFKRDLEFFGPRIRVWRDLMSDRGYNDPPFRALLLHAIVGGLPATLTTLTLLSSLDYLLLIGGFYAVSRAFGALAAWVSFASLALSAFARFEFIGGSLLRWDWLVALLVAVAAFARGRGFMAGILLGYAGLARLFPVVFLLPLAVKWLQERLGARADERVARCLGGAAGSIVVVGVALAAAGERTTHLLAFCSKIGRHGASVFINSIGLGSVLVLGAVPWEVGSDGGIRVKEAALATARPLPYAVALLSALYVLAVLPLVRRARPLESLLYAVPLVFCALSPPGYYYSFLVLLVLLPWENGCPDPTRLLEMALLSVTVALAYLLELVSRGLVPLFYRVSIEIGLFFLAWIGLEYARLGLAQRHGPRTARRL